MGPSGAGKSTFLDLISKRSASANKDSSVCSACIIVQGSGLQHRMFPQITFDGASDFDMRMVASYIEQDDALLGVLTVHETVEYAARLRYAVTYEPSNAILTRMHSLPYDTPSSIIHTLVDTTLDSLGLTDVAKNRIGTHFQRGISGGQKRRETPGDIDRSCSTWGQGDTNLLAGYQQYGPN